METPRLILASASPRRRELLAAAGYGFEVDPSDIEEPEPVGRVDAVAFVSELAWRKAHSVASRRPRGLVLAADTTCVLDGGLLNKPRDRADAERMIRLQEGREIDVLTGICLYEAGFSRWAGGVERSVLFMRRLTDAEREAYLDSGHWEGKAGAYGIQDEDPFVALREGSFSNVVGLPIERLAAMIEQVGAWGWGR